MAYLREMKRDCNTCRAKATVELRNRRNESEGFYCRSCGNRSLNRLTRVERENDKTIRKNPALKDALI